MQKQYKLLPMQTEPQSRQHCTSKIHPSDCRPQSPMLMSAVHRRLLRRYRFGDSRDNKWLVQSSCRAVDRYTRWRTNRARGLGKFHSCCRRFPKHCTANTISYSGTKQIIHSIPNRFRLVSRRQNTCTAQNSKSRPKTAQQRKSSPRQKAGQRSRMAQSDKIQTYEIHEIETCMWYDAARSEIGNRNR